jgi:hypothetical protein
MRRKDMEGVVVAVDDDDDDTCEAITNRRLTTVRPLAAMFLTVRITTSADRASRPVVGSSARVTHTTIRYLSSWHAG